MGKEGEKRKRREREEKDEEKDNAEAQSSQRSAEEEKGKTTRDNPRQPKRDSSLRSPTRRNTARKKKSGCSARNDGVGWSGMVGEGLTP